MSTSLEKENFEYKLVKPRLKIDIVSHPARVKGLGKYIYALSVFTVPFSVTPLSVTVIVIKYTWERHEPTYPPSYGLYSTTTVLLEELLRLEITYKGWYAINQRIQTIKKLYLITPCLTLSIIKYGSRVKWGNRG